MVKCNIMIITQRPMLHVYLKNYHITHVILHIVYYYFFMYEYAKCAEGRIIFSAE